MSRAVANDECLGPPFCGTRACLVECAEPLYRLRPVDPDGTDSRVRFVPVGAADPHEAMLLLAMSRAAWRSQGSPAELIVSLAAPLPPAPDLAPGGVPHGSDEHW